VNTPSKTKLEDNPEKSEIESLTSGVQKNTQPDAQGGRSFAYIAMIVAFWALIYVPGLFSPSLPALALLTGIWLAKENVSLQESPERGQGMVCSGILLVVGILVFAITIFFAVTAPPAPRHADIVDLLTSNPDLYTLSLGHLFDLTSQSMSLFRLPLALTGIAFLAGTVSSWWLRRRLKTGAANIALAAMLVVFLFAVHLALGTFYPTLGSKPLALAIHREFQASDTIVIDGTHSQASSINFYTGQQLHMLNARTVFPDSPPVFEDDSSFRKMWQGENRVFFVVYDRKGKEKLDALGRPYFEIAKSGGKWVYSNRSALHPAQR
jgi:hypothetical protein